MPEVLDVVAKLLPLLEQLSAEELQNPVVQTALADLAARLLAKVTPAPSA